MIERVLYDMLDAGVTYFSADTTRLNAIFQPDGQTARVTAAEMAKIRATWTAKPPDIRHGYATDPTQVPCYTIVLAEDRVEQYALGNLVVVEDGDPTAESVGAIEDRTYSLLVYATGADMALWYYKILKNIVLSRLGWLTTYLVQDPRWSGRELEPQQEMLPHGIYMRVLSLQVRVEEYYEQVDATTVYTDVIIMRDDVGGGIEPVEELD